MERYEELKENELNFKKYLEEKKSIILATYDGYAEMKIFYDENVKDEIKKIIEEILDDYYINANEKGVSWSCKNPVEPNKTWLARLFDCKSANER